MAIWGRVTVTNGKAIGSGLVFNWYGDTGTWGRRDHFKDTYLVYLMLHILTETSPYIFHAFLGLLMYFWVGHP